MQVFIGLVNFLALSVQQAAGADELRALGPDVREDRKCRTERQTAFFRSSALSQRKIRIKGAVSPLSYTRGHRQMRISNYLRANHPGLRTIPPGGAREAKQQRRGFPQAEGRTVSRRHGAVPCWAHRKGCADETQPQCS